MKKTTLQFLCDEDINQMPKTECGRYCAVCRKEIIDFRGMTKKQVDELRGKGACGIFLPEQVEDGITPIKLPKMRYVAAGFLTFIGMEAFSQPEMFNKKVVPTEVHVDDTTLVSTDKHADSETISGEALTKKEIRRIRNSTVSSNKRAFLNTHRASYFWSRRFPFIVKRRNHHTGF